MDQIKRTQLTLFIDGRTAGPIEQVRRAYNPVQYALIPAHVTLCREDELESLEQVLHNLGHLEAGRLAIDLGAVVRFSEGKGVMIPAEGDNEPFQQLRKKILQGIVENPRRHEPHITLMHPRNADCSDEIFAQIEKLEFSRRIEFGKISLIEQVAGGKWYVLKEFELE